MAFKRKTLKLYSDAAHGWLAVKRKELEELGILKDITVYSYQRGQTVYLEEHADMALYVNAKKEKGFQFIFGKDTAILDNTPEGKLITIDYYHCRDDKRSPIRSYDSFSF